MKDLTESIEHLNAAQRAQVLRQHAVMQENDQCINFSLSATGPWFENYLVKKGVWDSSITSARIHAAYLFYNNERLYSGKKVLDMGCGSGLMGLVMAACGADSVMSTDISEEAVENTKENFKSRRRIIRPYTPSVNSTVLQGDLFKPIVEYEKLFGSKGPFDFIVFAHPYFEGTPPQDDTIAASMLAPRDTIRRFLKDAPSFLAPGGTIMMPFYDLAGEANDPVRVAPEFGFKVQTCYKHKQGAGILQQGILSIHELTMR